MNIEALTHHIAHLKGTNILVSASAGAGKTTLLIKRLITRIIYDRISVNQICALTFSEAAAHEMKDRLKIKLREELEASQDLELIAFIKEQLALIDTAMISTIHSFALSMIKDFSYVLNLDPEMSSNVLDDGTSQLLFDECSEEVIRAAISNHPHLIQSLQNLVSTSSFDFSILKEIIQEIYQVRRLQLNPLSFDERVISLHEDPLSVIEPLLCEKLSHQIIEAIAKSDEVITLGLNANEDMKNVEVLRANLQNMLVKLNDNKLRDVNAQLHTTWFPILPKIKDKSYMDTKGELQGYIKSLGQAFNDLEDHVEHVRSILPHIQLVIELVKDLTALMHAKKSSLKVIEFDDMERLAYAILTHPDYDVPSFYRSRFSDILVDEFQDTNDLQNQIITLISTGDNVFRVGDVKQSIYRFRGAKPELMRSMFLDSKIEVFTLPHNFRSSQPIVDFNNQLFKSLMNVDGFNDVYLEKDHVTVGREAQKLITSPVTYLKVNKPSKEDIVMESMDEEIDDDNEESIEEGERFKTKSYETAADNVKARVITKDIIERHLSQNIPFKDICVLVKSHSQKDILKKLFDEKGIPHFINSPQGFLKHPTITQILMLAQYCLFPNDFYLSGVLLSDYTSLTTDDVAQLKLQGQLESALLNNHPEIHASLASLKERVLSSSLSMAIHECLKYNDFYHRCDSQGKLNGDALVQKAVDFESSHQGGLAAFIQSLEHLKDAKIAEAMDVALSDDVVKVMTIHASKGLQFPLVYLFNDESTTIHASKGQVIVDPKLGFTLRIKQDYSIEVTNIVREALIFAEKKAAYEEALRLWYVALTRAEKEMVCVGINKETTSYSTKLHASSILKSKGINGLLSGLQTFLPKLSIHEVKDPVRASIVTLKTKKTEDIQALPIINLTKQASIPLTPLDISNRLKPKEVGSLIHTILEHCVLSNNPIQDIQAMSLDLTTAQKEGIMSFFTHPLTKHWNEYQKHSEFPIITKNETGYHQYYLDLLMKNDEEWIIVDFKTDKVTHADELKERYSTQLRSYDQALRRYAPKLKTYIYSIVLKEAILINDK